MYIDSCTSVTCNCHVNAYYIISNDIEFKKTVMLILNVSFGLYEIVEQ